MPYVKTTILAINGRTINTLFPNFLPPQADVTAPNDHSYSSNSKPESQSLINTKSYGQLTTPSLSVIKVVKATDGNLRELVGDWTSVTKKAISTLKSNVLQEVKASCFQNLQQHSQESHMLDEQFRDDNFI